MASVTIKVSSLWSGAIGIVPLTSRNIAILGEVEIEGLITESCDSALPQTFRCQLNCDVCTSNLKQPTIKNIKFKDSFLIIWLMWSWNLSNLFSIWNKHNLIYNLIPQDRVKNKRSSWVFMLSHHGILDSCSPRHFSTWNQKRMELVGTRWNVFQNVCCFPAAQSRPGRVVGSCQGFLRSPTWSKIHGATWCNGNQRNTT